MTVASEADEEARAGRAAAMPSTTTRGDVEEDRLGRPQRQVGLLEPLLDLLQEALALGEVLGDLDGPLERARSAAMPPSSSSSSACRSPRRTG